MCNDVDNECDKDNDNQIGIYIIRLHHRKFLT